MWDQEKRRIISNIKILFFKTPCTECANFLPAGRVDLSQYELTWTSQLMTSNFSWNLHSFSQLVPTNYMEKVQQTEFTVNPPNIGHNILIFFVNIVKDLEYWNFFLISKKCFTNTGQHVYSVTCIIGGPLKFNREWPTFAVHIYAEKIFILKLVHAWTSIVQTSAK